MKRRTRAIIIKEFFHILRDPRSLVIVLILPLLMMFIFGYSLSFDINQIETVVVDYSQSELSCSLIEKFAADPYVLTGVYPGRINSVNPVAQAEDMLRKGSIKQYVIIPVNFSSGYHKDIKQEITAVIEGTDSNIANIVHQYNEMLLMDFVSERKNLKDFLSINTKTYFNPENKSSFFIIPGLVAVIMMMISALLTSLSVSREKETGSIELLYISPLSSREIIIGKTIPYIFVALMEGAFIILFAKFWFIVPFRGNFLILLVFALLYVITGLSFGITISTLASTQKVAMMATLLATLLPSILLSGFIFPLDSLPPVLRSFSYAVPATYFLLIIRGVILKGAGLQHFIREGIVLLAFSFIFLNIASIKFTGKRKNNR